MNFLCRHRGFALDVFKPWRPTGSNSQSLGPLHKLFWPPWWCRVTEWRDHAGLITSRLSLLSSTACARPGRVEITEFCRRPLTSACLPSLAPLHTNTPGEIGHQVTHTVLTTPGTLLSVPSGLRNGPRPRRGLSVGVVCLQQGRHK